MALDAWEAVGDLGLAFGAVCGHCVRWVRTLEGSGRVWLSNDYCFMNVATV